MEYYISNSVLRWFFSSRLIEAEDRAEALQKYIEEVSKKIDVLDSFDIWSISKLSGEDIKEISE